MDEDNNNDFQNKMKEIANSLSNDSIEQLLSYYENENKPKEEINDDANKKEISSAIEQKNTNKIVEERKQEIKDIVQQLNIPKENIASKSEINKIEKDEEIAEAKEEDIKEIEETIDNTEKLHEEIVEKKQELEKGLIELNNIEADIVESIEDKDLFTETKTEKDTINAMEQIATSTSYSSNLLNYTDPKVSENQFKLFIIAQCKRELYKILEYSKILDKLEERFKQVYIDRIDELSDGTIVSLMQLMLDKIDRGNELINSVIKDKDITNVLIINQQNNSVNNISDLTKDKLLQTLYKSSELHDEAPSASRAKVVEVVTNILKNEADEDKSKESNTIVNEPSNIDNPIAEKPILSEETNSQVINDDLDRRLAELQKQNNQ